MTVTMINATKYVDSAGRNVTVTDYGKDFYSCKHNFEDTGRRGKTQVGNGNMIPAKAFRCTECGVFRVQEGK